MMVIEEGGLVEQLLDSDKRGFPIRPKYLRGMAHTLFPERTRVSPAELGVNWAYKFVNRHHDLRKR
jgi:hypothetical protein